MKPRTVVAVLLLVSWLAQASPVDARGKNSQAADILNASYEAARNLEPQERAYYLNRLTRLAGKISHQRTSEWCAEQYNLASKPIPGVDDWTRVSTLKNALTAWSQVDPNAALERLDNLARLPAPTYPLPNQMPTEDLRADAAVVVFPSAWHVLGPKGLSTIENIAFEIGVTGQYPQRPMLYIMEELNRSGDEPLKGEIDKIFIAAINAYNKKKDVEYANEDGEFVAMLEGAQYVVPEVLFKQGLNDFVQHLLDNLDQPTPNFRGDVSTSKGVFHFDNRRELLLFRVFPLISKFEPDWAQKLRNEHPAILEHAGDQVEHYELGIIEGPVDQEQLQRFRQRMETRAASEKINALKKTNPWAALQLAENLSGNARLVSISDIMPNLMQADPTKAAELYSRQVEDLRTIEGDSKPNLTARIALAKAAFYVGDANAFSDLVIKSFDYAVAQFRNSDKKAIMRPGYNELVDLVGFCTMHGATWILDNVKQLRSSDPMLEAYLLIAAADGITEQPAALRTESQIAQDKPQSNSSEKVQANSKKPKVAAVTASMPPQKH